MGNGFVEDPGLAAAIIVPPPPSDDFTREDMELWRAAMRSFELAMRRQARWYGSSSSKSSHTTAISLAPGGVSGQGVKVVEERHDRIFLTIFCPSTAISMYYNTHQGFGSLNSTTNTASSGLNFEPGTYLTYGPEYFGEVWLFNAAASGNVDIRIEELFIETKVRS